MAGYFLYKIMTIRSTFLKVRLLVLYETVIITDVRCICLQDKHKIQVDF